MNDNLNVKFAETASDPVRRRDAIAGISRRCAWLSCVNGIMSIGIISVIYFKPEPIDVCLVFVCCMIWMQVYKYESDLRLLRVIDRLHKDDKTVA
jgi:hypothetical protein